MKDFSMRLLGDLVAVRPGERKRTKVILPDWQRSLEGVVLAVGPGAPRINGGVFQMEVRAGDRVTFGAAKGMEALHDGVPIRIMRQTDIDVVVGHVNDF